MTAEELRPLVLQNTCHKWVAAVLGFQLNNVLAALMPGYQKGLIRDRCIFEHSSEAAGTWASLPNGLSCPIDFSKAFDFVARRYCRAFFELMRIPPLYALLFYYLFKVPDHI